MLATCSSQGKHRYVTFSLEDVGRRMRALRLTVVGVDARDGDVWLVPIGSMRSGKVGFGR